MTDASRTGLKVIVERAVRPVAASLHRKRAMREELLGHVTAVFEEESARLGDEAAALAEAARRFGDPAAVAADLQRTVPRYDRYSLAVERLMGSRPGESEIRRAARGAVILTTLLVGSVAAVFAAAFAFGPAPYRTAEVVGTIRAFLAPLAIATVLGTFVFIPLGEALARAWFVPPGRRSPLRAVAILVVAGVVPAAVPFLFNAFIGTPAEAAALLRPSAPLLPLVPAILAAVVWQVEKERRYVREWAELDLD